MLYGYTRYEWLNLTGHERDFIRDLSEIRGERIDMRNANNRIEVQSFRCNCCGNVIVVLSDDKSDITCGKCWNIL
jgi:hypothetical protein